MATTVPTEFVGTPTLTAEKIATLKEWYVSTLGDCDKASDVDDASWYWGASSYLESVLRLLHNMPDEDESEKET